MANIHIKHNSSFQGGGGLLQRLPAGGHWRHSRHVHWTQLSHGLGWDGVVLAKISSQQKIEDIKYKKFKICLENAQKIGLINFIKPTLQLHSLRHKIIRYFCEAIDFILHTCQA